jgi:hypothetical protein
MSSVARFLKQIPTDGQYFLPIPTSNNIIPLAVFNKDAASATTSYVSGAAAGNFTTSNVTISAFTPTDPSGFNDISGGLFLFRDMGKTIVSSARTFRRVQLLKLSGNMATGADTAAGNWTSITSATGVWQPSNNGVVGNPSNSVLIDADFGCFYFETGARGLGIAQGLIRYG